MNYIKPERISLKDHRDYDEKWVQARIADDPSILGLGDLVLRDKERGQPRAGRLDLLLQDTDSYQRYEVEVQLGGTDEAHIIRTIEYWDIERKRYPQYEHVAVIVAEDITSRFLNVISLFNGTIPLIAIQLQAMKFGDSIGLVATKVLDLMDRGLVDEDEGVAAVTDRSYWEARGTKESIQLADALLEIVKKLDPKLELKYNKFYIGLAKDDSPNNFVIMGPHKKFTSVRIRLQQEDKLNEKLEQSGLDFDYVLREGRYRIRMTLDQVKNNLPLLEELLRASYEG
jgi:predicted transport protein